MEIFLRKGQTTSVKLLDDDREPVVVQFSKDPFGNVQVEAWSPGKTQLFSINVPAEELAVRS